MNRRVRTQAEPGARGGGGAPLVGEQRQLQGGKRYLPRPGGCRGPERCPSWLTACGLPHQFSGGKSDPTVQAIRGGEINVDIRQFRIGTACLLIPEDRLLGAQL